MRVTTGTYLCRQLEARGVDLVFGIPGVHTIELYRGLVGSAIRHITPRHEQGAGFMADGYARTCGKPGVAFVISGPGVSNIVTAMGQAYGDSVPMLVISSVNAQGRMDSGQGWLHELADQRGMSAHVTAFSRTIRRPEDLAPALDEAFALFASARPRPVHLEIPTDVLAMEAGHLDIDPAPIRAAVAAQGSDAAAALLAGSARPVILAGGGLRASPQPLAEALDAPVVMTVNARGLMPHSHPLAVPFSPSLPAVRALIAESDAVLALGTELGPTDCDMYEDGGFALPERLIRVDIDAAQIARGPDAALALMGDAAATTQALLGALDQQPMRAGDGAARALAACDAARAGLDWPMQAALRLLEALRKALPDALFVGDSTQLVYAGNLGFSPARGRAWWNSATGFGTLGYGLPAAIGAGLGAPGRPVIALLGDGGLQFSLAELASATEAGVPVIALVHDNTGYGEIKSAMRAADVNPIGVDLFTPDLEAIARACGWRVDRPDSPQALVEMCKAAAARPVPGMILFGDRLVSGFAPGA